MKRAALVAPPGPCLQLRKTYFSTGTLSALVPQPPWRSLATLNSITSPFFRDDSACSRSFCDEMSRLAGKSSCRMTSCGKNCCHAGPLGDTLATCRPLRYCSSSLNCETKSDVTGPTVIPSLSYVLPASLLTGGVRS